MVFQLQGGVSPAQARRQRKQLLRELEAGERKRHSATIAELERQELEARKRRRAELKAAKARCKAGVQAAKQRAAEAFQQAREAAERAWKAAKEARAAEKKATRQAALDACALDRRHVEDEAAERLAAIERRKEEEQRYRRAMASIQRINKAREKDHRKASASERRSESDDAVVANLPESLLPLWNKVKRGIKGSDRRSRTEEFLQYAAEHPGEALAAQQELADRELQRLQRAYYQQARQSTSGARSNARRRRAAVEESAHVPF